MFSFPVNSTQRIFFYLLLVFPFFFSSCSATIRSSTGSIPDKTNSNTQTKLRQNIRVLIDEETKEFSFRLDVDTEIYIGDEKKGIISEGEKVTVSSIKGSVTLISQSSSISATTLKIRPSKKSEFINFHKKSYRGELWFVAQGSKTFVVNYLDLEDYLLGVVPLEIGLKNNYYFEALKCAAVAGRTFALNRIVEKRSIYDVTDGVKDQAYGGLDVETGIDSRAVRETEGLILTYQQKPAMVFYHANCGGYTEDIANVFGPVNLPYLKGVPDGDPPYCEKSPSYRWTESYAPFEIIKYLFDAQLIKSKNLVLEGLEIKERHPSGRAKNLIVLIKDQKPLVIPGSKIRDIIKSKKDNTILRSSNFTIDLVQKDGVLNKVILTGKGNGHGVGMCQWGALNLSRAEVPYTTILAHFFPGTEITQVYDN